VEPSRFNRREFARRATRTAALTLALPIAAAQKPPSPDNRIRMGFLDAGEMGSGDLADMMRATSRISMRPSKRPMGKPTGSRIFAMCRASRKLTRSDDHGV
jgi:hypothetical protein